MELSRNTTISTSTNSRVIHKEACPLCVAEGRDTAGDNLAVYDDGHKHCYAGHGLIAGNKEDFILSENTYEYLPWRGISKETMQFYDVKTKIDAEGKPISLGFKYPNDSYKVRLVAKKEFYTTGNINEGGLYGQQLFAAGSAKYVTITEGELDALSLFQALRSPSGQSPVVSVHSSSSVVRDITAARAWLNSFDRIYLAFDNDEHGRRAVAQVAKLFDFAKVFHVKFSNRKDANEYLAAGEAESLRKIWWNSKQYMPEAIKADIADFKTILEEKRKVGIPYPFKGVTDMTYGIRTGETVLITAQEKVGKTELMHFIEHQILTETDDNVGAIFLEEPAQRHLHALAGIQLKLPVHLPDTNASDDEILGAVSQVVRRDGRLHIYSYFGSDDPAVFLDTIRFLATARGCRYVLIDHISMVVSGNSNNRDERKELDWFSTRIEMLAKELDIAIIIVSHVNDDGQTRGSRYMTKVFDITINATRDLMNVDPIERSTIHLSIPYNRFCSRTGDAGAYTFNEATYSFTQRAANDNEVQRTEPDRRAA